MTHLDLFSGIGGFSLAAQWAGFQTIAFAEIEPYPSSVLARHWPDIPNLGDVTKLCRRIHDCEYDEDSGEAYCPRCRAEFGECACIGTDQFTDTYGWPDLITGGVPCQPASLIGARRGSDDERWLWPDAIRIVRELRPRFCLFENPSAILSLEQGRAFNGIASGLVECGYDLWWEVLPAAAVGAGHRRERVWVFAADANSAGLERHAGNVQDGERTAIKPQARRHIAEAHLPVGRIASEKWYHQSGIKPVVDGLPGRVARERLTAIGNALVPQVPHLILSAVAAACGGCEGSAAA